MLLEWCEADPVDTWEMGRNEVVQDIQGNRNVFIDYPELAWIIFNRDIPNDMTTPSGEAKNQKPDDGNSGGSTGGNTSCAHTNTGTINQADATCGAEGNTGDTYCYDCQKIIDSGSPIPATGKHSFGNWELDTENGVKTRECIVCEFKESVDINAAECSHGMSETRNKQAATCGKSGYSGDKCCVLCGYVIQTGRVLPATGNHSYGEAVVIREPTNVKNGLAEKTCADCHTKSVIVINALCSNEDLTKEILIDGIEDNPTKILLLMALGVSDKALLEELYK